MTSGGRVVHCKVEAYDVYIGRGRGSIWGNPFTHKEGTQAVHVVASRDEAVRQFESYILGTPELLERLPELRGKCLGCWCKPAACHGDVLVRLANLPEAELAEILLHARAAREAASPRET